MRGLTLGDKQHIENEHKPEKKIDPLAGNPEKWRISYNGNFSGLALPVLKGFLKETTNEGRAKWVRNPDLFLSRSKNWRVNFTPRIKDQTLHKWKIDHIKNTAYLILETKNAQFMPERIYFTRENNELKIDWATSTALSDITFQSIKSARKKSLITLLLNQNCQKKFLMKVFLSAVYSPEKKAFMQAFIIASITHHIN